MRVRWQIAGAAVMEFSGYGILGVDYRRRSRSSDLLETRTKDLSALKTHYAQRYPDARRMNDLGPPKTCRNEFGRTGAKSYPAIRKLKDGIGCNLLILFVRPERLHYCESGLVCGNKHEMP